MRNIVEIFTVLLFFVFPSIFAKQSNEITNLSSFSFFQVAFYLVTCIYFFIRIKNIKSQIESKKHKTAKNNKIHCFIVLSVLTFFFLTINGFIWQKLSNATPLTYDFPQKIPNMLFQVLGICVFAFFEECVYRFFLPLSIQNVMSNSNLFFSNDYNQIANPNKNNKKNKQLLSITLELIIVLFFAFAHNYMGFFAIMNAFFSGLTLRLLAIKTNSIIYTGLVHFFYNLMLYLLM